MSTVHAPADVTLGFTSQDEEIVLDRLEVSGELPAWLAGSLLRTGPARFEAGARTVNHWFDGFAKLHRFSFAGGEVSYAARFLRSRAFEAAERTGDIAYREYMTDPCRSAFRRVASMFRIGHDITDNGNVNVARLGEQWLALTETPMNVAFDPETLATLGVVDPPPADTTTAHPLRDGDGLWGHGTRFGPRSSYVVYEQRPGASRTVAKIPVRRPAYHHSFSMTPRRAVLFEAPYTVNPLRLATGTKAFAECFEWHPQDSGRFLAVDRQTGAPAGEWEVEPFFCFHHVNAFEEDGALVVDLLAFEDPGIVEALSLGRLRDGQPVPLPRLRRYRLGDDGSVDMKVIGDVGFELPVFDGAACGGRPYRHVWGAGAHTDGAFFDQIVGLDVSTGEHRTWHEPGTHPGEPVLVKRPGAMAEDDGVLLSVVLEPAREASSLLVLDASSLEEVARARVPHHIPHSFHGSFAAAG